MTPAPIPHQLVPVLALKQTLAADTVLAAMTVSGFSGGPQTIKGIHVGAVPQIDKSKGPWVVIAPPIFHNAADRKTPNGPNRIAADFIVPVWLHMRDVEPDNLDLNRMLARIIGLFEGRRISVDGGEVFTITIYGDATPQRVDKGTYIFTAIGVKFLAAVQVD